jgi:hypothetical protein
MKTYSGHPNLTPQALPPIETSLVALVNGLKKSLEDRLTLEFRNCLSGALIRHALDEAALTAQTTEFPHLFFPALAEEKVRMISAAVCNDTLSSQHEPLRAVA